MSETPPFARRKPKIVYEDPPVIGVGQTVPAEPREESAEPEVEDVAVVHPDGSIEAMLRSGGKRITIGETSEDDNLHPSYRRWRVLANKQPGLPVVTIQSDTTPKNPATPVEISTPVSFSVVEEAARVDPQSWRHAYNPSKKREVVLDAEEH